MSHSCGKAFLTLFFLLSSAIPPSDGTASTVSSLTVPEIVERTIRAVGGREKIDQIKNYCFRAGLQTVFVDAGGRLKIQSGFEPPIVYEVLLINESGVQKNSRGRIEELTGIEKIKWLSLCRLYSGLFTLKNVRTPLTLEGVRVFGPERSYRLSAVLGNVRISYDIDVADFLVKRLILETINREDGAQKSICELGPVQSIRDLKIPSRIYLADVGISGTFGPRAMSAKEVIFNPSLQPETFAALDVNAGRWSVSSGSLSGQVLAVFSDDQDNTMRIYTNWTRSEIEKAELKTGDELIATIGDIKVKVKFYFGETELNSDPTFDWAPGKVAMWNEDLETILFHIHFTSMPRDRYDRLKAAIQPLVAIKAEKIAATGV
jgi:hypothetical protein